MLKLRSHALQHPLPAWRSGCPGGPLAPGPVAYGSRASILKPAPESTHRSAACRDRHTNALTVHHFLHVPACTFEPWYCICQVQQVGDYLQSQQWACMKPPRHSAKPHGGGNKYLHMCCSPQMNTSCPTSPAPVEVLQGQVMCRSSGASRCHLQAAVRSDVEARAQCSAAKQTRARLAAVEGVLWGHRPAWLTGKHLYKQCGKS